MSGIGPKPPRTPPVNAPAKPPVKSPAKAKEAVNPRVTVEADAVKARTAAPKDSGQDAAGGKAQPATDKPNPGKRGLPGKSNDPKSVGKVRPTNGGQREVRPTAPPTSLLDVPSKVAGGVVSIVKGIGKLADAAKGPGAVGEATAGSRDDTEASLPYGPRVSEPQPVNEPSGTPLTDDQVKEFGWAASLDEVQSRLNAARERSTIECSPTDQQTINILGPIAWGRTMAPRWFADKWEIGQTSHAQRHLQAALDEGKPLQYLESAVTAVSKVAKTPWEHQLGDRVKKLVDEHLQRLVDTEDQELDNLGYSELESKISKLEERVREGDTAAGLILPRALNREASLESERLNSITLSELSAHIDALQDRTQRTRFEQKSLELSTKVYGDRKDTALRDWARMLPTDRRVILQRALEDHIRKGQASPLEHDVLHRLNEASQFRFNLPSYDTPTITHPSPDAVTYDPDSIRAHNQAMLEALTSDFVCAWIAHRTGDPELGKMFGGLFQAAGGMATARNDFRAIRPTMNLRDRAAEVRRMSRDRPADPPTAAALRSRADLEEVFQPSSSRPTGGKSTTRTTAQSPPTGASPSIPRAAEGSGARGRPPRLQSWAEARTKPSDKPAPPTLAPTKPIEKTGKGVPAEPVLSDPVKGLEDRLSFLADHESLLGKRNRTRLVAARQRASNGKMSAAERRVVADRIRPWEIPDDTRLRADYTKALGGALGFPVRYVRKGGAHAGGDYEATSAALRAGKGPSIRNIMSNLKNGVEVELDHFNVETRIARETKSSAELIPEMLSGGQRELRIHRLRQQMENHGQFALDYSLRYFEWEVPASAIKNLEAEVYAHMPGSVRQKIRIVEGTPRE
jgi:hypothetical protein